MYGKEAPVNKTPTRKLLDQVNPKKSTGTYGIILVLIQLYNTEACTPTKHKAGDDAWWAAWRERVFELITHGADSNTFRKGAKLMREFVEHLRLETLQPATASRLPTFLKACDRTTAAGRGVDHLANPRSIEDGEGTTTLLTCMLCAVVGIGNTLPHHRRQLSLGALVRYVRDVILAPEAPQQKRKRAGQGLSREVGGVVERASGEESKEEGEEEGESEDAPGEEGHAAAGGEEHDVCSGQEHNARSGEEHGARSSKEHDM